MDKKSDWLHRGLILVAGVAVVFSVSVIYFAFAFFERTAPGLGDKNIIDIRAALGQLGDFYGGVLNPILSFVTIVLVVITLLMQRSELMAAQKELAIQRDQTEKQNKAFKLQGFEQTFFAWMNSYREIVSNVQYADASGRKALRELFEEIGGYDTIDKYLYSSVDIIAYDQWHSGMRMSETEITVAGYLNSRWDDAYLDNAFQLDTMFRTLYNLVRWIDTQPNDVLNDNEKVKYMRILRSQISISEGYLLVLNALTDRGKKFVFAINKYALFDNVTPLPASLESALKHLNKNGLSPAAFSSYAARKAKFDELFKPPRRRKKLKP